MNIREKELIDYLVNCNRADKLKKQIQKVNEELDAIEKAEYMIESGETVLEALAREAHNLRIKKLGLRLDLSTVERKILQFELAEELRD